MTLIKPFNIHSYRDIMTQESISHFTKHIEEEDNSVKELFKAQKNRIEEFGEFYLIEDMIKYNLFDVPQSNTNYNYMVVSPSLNFNHNINYSEVLPYKVYRIKYTGERKLEDTLSHIYGVADNLDQIDEYVNSKIKEAEKYYKSNLDEINFVVTVTPILKSHEPEDGGWRWSKWGQYIGTRESEAEYLYDEPEIDSIFVFEVLVIEKSVK